MDIIPGEVYCLKVTGEKVYVLQTIVSDTKTIVHVRRPQITDTGSIHHFEENYNIGELESLESHGERQAQEVLLKTRVNNKLTKLLEAEEQKETQVPPTAAVQKVN